MSALDAVVQLRGDSRSAVVVIFASGSQIALFAGAALLTTLLLPVTDRGRYVLLVTVLAVTTPLAGLGSNVGMRRARPTHPNPRALETAYFRLTCACALAHGLITPLVVWFATSGQVPHGLAELAAVFVLAIAQVGAWQFVEFWYSRLQYLLGAAYATANAAASLLAALSAFIVSPSFLHVVTTQAAVAIAIQMGQGIHIRICRARDLDQEPVLLMALAGEMVKVGVPSLVMTAGMALTFRLDRLILGATQGPAGVAVYALAGSFAELPRVIPAAIGQIANGRAALSGRKLALRPYLLPAFGLSLVAAAAAGIIGLLIIHRAGPAYVGSTTPLIILLIAEMALVPYSIIVRMILGGGRVTLSARVGVVAILLSTGIYWLAIHQYQTLGAAWASVAVYLGVSIACWIVHRRQKEVRT